MKINTNTKLLQLQNSATKTGPNIHTTDRNSHQRCPIKKGELKILQNSYRKTPVPGSPF